MEERGGTALILHIALVVEPEMVIHVSVTTPATHVFNMIRNVQSASANVQRPGVY